MKLSESIAEDPFWSESRLASPGAIRRMRDIEFVSDLLIGVLHGPQSGSPKTLDQYYATYEIHDREFPKQRECKRRFSRALDLIQEVVPDIRTTRWANKTDFYSLFVATAHILRKDVLPGDKYEAVSARLEEFADNIAEYQEDEDVSVSQEVIDYVEAISQRHF